MKLKTSVNEFLEYLEVEKGCSPLTIRNYRHYLTRFYDWLSENYPTMVKPEDIDLNIIKKYRLFLARLRKRDGTQLRRATQTYYILALRALLRYLIVQRDVPALSPDKIQLPKQSSHLVQFLDSEQVERLLDTPEIANKAVLRDKAILETLFSTGLRVSELVKLNRDQINLERKEFGVKGKGGKLRVVFLSDTASHWLDRYLQSRNDNFAPLFIRYSGTVDARNNGERMRLTARSVQKIVSKYAKKCRLPVEVTPHTLRHSFATDLLMRGADLRSVQEMLGHQSIRTTQVYTHVTNRHLKEVHKAFHGRK